MNLPEEKKTRERNFLESKIRLLSEFVWENRIINRILSEWITQFDEHDDIEHDEQMPRAVLA